MVSEGFTMIMAMNECNHNRKKEQAHPIDCIQSHSKVCKLWVEHWRYSSVPSTSIPSLRFQSPNHHWNFYGKFYLKLLVIMKHQWLFTTEIKISTSKALNHAINQKLKAQTFKWYIQTFVVVRLYNSSSTLATSQKTETFQTFSLFSLPFVRVNKNMKICLLM